jgi:hypothetical protein
MPIVFVMLKGPWHEIFDLYFFHLTTSLGPRYMGLFEYGFEVAKIFDFEKPILATAVSMTQLSP